MNYTVKMSEEAENNLKAVIEYISIELKMPHAASNLYYCLLYTSPSPRDS